MSTNAPTFTELLTTISAAGAARQAQERRAQAQGTTPPPPPREPSSAPSGALPGPFSVPGFESLAAVLTEAYDQAARGKGAERHGRGAPFDEQPMQDLIRLYGTGFALGQSAKKTQEAQRLPTVDRQVRELLGAIVYIAGAIIHIQEKESA